MADKIDTSKIDSIIFCRVEPYIYAFETNTVPNFLKVGDTYRPVNVRLAEWKKIYSDLEKKYEHIAKVDENTYFRDYSVHDFLIKNGYAVLATPTGLDRLNKENKEKAEAEKEDIKRCEELKNKLEKCTYKFQVKTGAGDRVFGSVSAKQLASELKNKGYEIDKKQININENLGIRAMYRYVFPDSNFLKKNAQELTIGLRYYFF